MLCLSVRAPDVKGPLRQREHGLADDLAIIFICTVPDIFLHNNPARYLVVDSRPPDFRKDCHILHGTFS